MKDTLVDIPYKYTPRWYQEGVFNAIADGMRRAAVVWHRRAGKDKTFFNIMIKESQKRVGIYYYLFPTYQQGRKILWDGIDKAGFKFLDHIPEEIRAKNPNNTDMKQELKNGSIIQVVGTDKIDSVVGTNPVGCVFSEYSLQNPKAWDLIRPILSENGGWALFNWTPRGHNHAWELGKIAQKNPDWYYELLTVNDTNAVTEEEIRFERDSGMTEDMIQQEYYCSYDAASPGAYYANELARVRKEGRIGYVPVAPNVPVDIFYDLGFNDQTSMWFVQLVMGELRVLKYMSDRNKDISYYVNIAKDWRDEHGCILGMHVLPHDGKNHTVASAMSPYEILRDMHIEVDIVDRPSRKTVGLDSVRQVFPRCWFDFDGCVDGIDLLAQYHSEFDIKRGVQDQTPVHDVASHCADAFQTMALYHVRDVKMGDKGSKGNNIYVGNFTIDMAYSGSSGGSWMV